MRHGKTDKAIQAAVKAARAGARLMLVSTKQGERRVHETLAEYQDGTRHGDAWHFGPGSVEVVT